MNIRRGTRYKAWKRDPRFTRIDGAMSGERRSQALQTRNIGRELRPDEVGAKPVETYDDDFHILPATAALLPCRDS